MKVSCSLKQVADANILDFARISLASAVAAAHCRTFAYQSVSFVLSERDRTPQNPRFMEKSIKRLTP